MCLDWILVKCPIVLDEFGLLDITLLSQMRLATH